MNFNTKCTRSVASRAFDKSTTPQSLGSATRRLSCFCAVWFTACNALATNFSTQLTGDWANAANWTPMGVPGAGDIAYIDNNSTPVGGPALTLSADVTVQGVVLGVNGVARLDLNGRTLTLTDALQIGAFGGQGFVDGRGAGAGRIIASQLHVSSAVNSNFALHPLDRVQRFFVADGAQATTSALANLAAYVALDGQGSSLKLGAPLSLSGDLVIAGNGTSAARVDAQNSGGAIGYAITAQNIHIGQFGDAGAILNDGPITAIEDLEVSRGAFTLDADDQVGRQVQATLGGVLTLDANTAARSAYVANGGTIHTAATGNANESALVLGQNSLLNLGAPLTLAQELTIRGTGSNAARVNANGHAIRAADIRIGQFGEIGQILNRGPLAATRDLEVGAGTFALGSADSVARQVQATYGAALTLHANTAARSALVANGGRIDTVAANNLSESASVAHQGSLLQLGANLTLSGDLRVRGAGVNSGRIDANGHNVTARDIYVGEFGDVGELVEVGALSAARLFLERSQLELTGGDDVLSTQLDLRGGAALNVLQGPGEQAGLTLQGNTLRLFDTSVIRLSFDANTAPGTTDYAFRWANPNGGNRVSALQSLIAAGRIVVNAPTSVGVYAGSDGFTYVGVLGAAAPPGDFDGDGDADGSDFLVWQRQFGMTITPAGSGADANNDGVVSGADLQLWQNDFGGAASVGTAIPEGTSGMLALTACWAWTMKRRRSKGSQG